MEIERIYAVDLDLPHPEPETDPRREAWSEEARVANPMTRYLSSRRESRRLRRA